MTDIIVAPRVEDPLSDTEAVASSGYVRVRPSAPYNLGGQWVQNVWSAPVSLAGSALTFKLDALADTPYELHVHIPDSGGDYDLHEFRIVTASGVPLKWEDLVQVLAPGTAPVVLSSLEARVAALEAAGPSVGGTSTLLGVLDMSASARTFNAQATYSEMRSTLGAGTSSLAIGTTGGTAADGTTAGTATSAAADASTAQTTANTAVTNASTAQTTANGKMPYPAGGVDGAVAVKTGAGASWSTVLVSNLVESTAVDSISYSPTVPTGVATNGALILTPVVP